MENKLIIRKFNNINKIETNEIAPIEFNQNWINEYSDYLQYKPKTKNAYISNTIRFIEWLNVNGIANPTRKDIIEFKNELINGVKDDNGEWIIKPKEASTIQAYINSVKQFFKWLSYENIYEDITDGIHAPHVETLHRKNPLSEEEARFLINSIDTSTLDGKRNKLMISMAIDGGLRDNEIANIQIKDFYRYKNETRLHILGKGHDTKDDFVKIPLEIKEILNEYLNAIGEELNETNESYLFKSFSNRNAKNVPMLANSISRIIKQLLINANLKNRTITAHSLRHTTAQLLNDSGASLEEIQQIMRHKNISTTMVYLKEWERDKNNGEQIIANKLFAH